MRNNEIRKGMRVKKSESDQGARTIFRGIEFAYFLAITINPLPLALSLF